MTIDKDMLEEIENITMTDYEIQDEITQYQFDSILGDLLDEIESLKMELKEIEERQENRFYEEIYD